MIFQTVGFIGTGNMGGILAEAVRRQAPEARLLLSNRTPEKARKLAEALGGEAVSAVEAAREAELLFLAVKPGNMAGLFDEIAPVLAGRPDRVVLASPAAGLETAALQRMARGAYGVIRLMPNTPTAVGRGVILYCTADVTPEEEEAFRALMASAGLVDRLPEKLIDAGCALSGCGPAFVFQFLEAMADGGVAAGLPRDKALLYAAETVLGSAKLLLESGKHPGQLKDAVTSPAGATIEGVRLLEERAFRGAVTDAVLASFEKTVSMR